MTYSAGFDQFGELISRFFVVLNLWLLNLGPSQYYVDGRFVPKYSKNLR